MGENTYTRRVYARGAKHAQIPERTEGMKEGMNGLKNGSNERMNNRMALHDRRVERERTLPD